MNTRKWHPFNTAPKDGRQIWVATRDDFLGAASWRKSHYGDMRWFGAPGDELYWDESDLILWMEPIDRPKVRKPK